MEKDLTREVEDRIGNRQLEVVSVLWVDSSHNNYGWHEPEIDGYTLVPIRTCGYLLTEDENRVVITMSIGRQGLVFDAFVIPRGCIISLDRLPSDNAQIKDKE